MTNKRFVWMPALRWWQCVKCSPRVESTGTLDAISKDPRTGENRPTYRHAGCGGLFRPAPSEAER